VINFKNLVLDKVINTKPLELILVLVGFDF